MRNLGLVFIAFFLIVANKKVQAQEESIQGQDVTINNFIVKV